MKQKSTLMSKNPKIFDNSIIECVVSINRIDFTLLFLQCHYRCLKSRKCSSQAHNAKKNWNLNSKCFLRIFSTSSHLFGTFFVPYYFVLLYSLSKEVCYRTCLFYNMVQNWRLLTGKIWFLHLTLRSNMFFYQPSSPLFLPWNKKNGLVDDYIVKGPCHRMWNSPLVKKSLLCIGLIKNQQITSL